MARVSKIMPREGVGVALNAQVWHDTLMYTVFTKKCQKRSKGGYPLVLTRFREDCEYQGTPHPRMASRMAKTA